MKHKPPILETVVCPEGSQVETLPRGMATALAVVTDATAKGTIQECIQELARKAGELYPGWYGEGGSEPTGSDGELEAGEEPGLIARARKNPEVDPSWLRRVIDERMAQLKAPWLPDYPDGAQARQLAETLSDRDASIWITLADTAASSNDSLTGFAKACLWIHDNTGLKVEVYIPDNLKSHPELITILFHTRDLDAQEPSKPDASGATKPGASGTVPRKTRPSPPKKTQGGKEHGGGKEAKKDKGPAPAKPHGEPVPGGRDTKKRAPGAHDGETVNTGKIPGPKADGEGKASDHGKGDKDTGTGLGPRGKDTGAVRDIGDQGAFSGGDGRNLGGKPGGHGKRPDFEKIIGGPHPRSKGEQLLYDYIMGDPFLKGLFTFNTPLKTKDGSNLIVDLLWAGGKLVIEVDSFRYHRHKDAFESDRHRDYLLFLSGYRVLRLTNIEIMRSVDEAAEKIRDIVRFLMDSQKTGK
jgi:very-short-patch-repair endonuclease